MYARLEMKEDLESEINLVVFRSKADADSDDPHGRALHFQTLSNKEIAELMVVKRIKVIRTDNNGVPLWGVARMKKPSAA